MFSDSLRAGITTEMLIVFFLRPDLGFHAGPVIGALSSMLHKFADVLT